MTVSVHSEHPHDTLYHIKRKAEILSHALKGAEESVGLSDAFSICCMDLESDLSQVIEKLENPDGFENDVHFKEAQKGSQLPHIFWFRTAICTCPDSSSWLDPNKRGIVVPVLDHQGFTFKIVLNNFQVLRPEKNLYFNTLLEATEGGKNWFTLRFAEQLVAET